MTGRSRAALALAAVLAAAWTGARYLDWSREQHRLGELLDRVDAGRVIPGLPEHVERAGDPSEARMRAGRALVAHYLDPTWVYELPEEERLAAWNTSLEALDEIHAMAAETMAERPASWEAAMLYGASAYLLGRRRQAGGEAPPMAGWQRPLERASELIPSYLEPARYLAVAYVDHWQSLPSEQRDAARAVLRRAFTDPGTFGSLIEAWLRLVPDRREALSIVPDESYVWERLQSIFLRNHEWRYYLETRRRLALARGRQIDDFLSEAEAQIAGGDYYLGARSFHRAASLLEPSLDNVSTLHRILDRMPAGPPSREAEASFRRWLEWTLRLGFLRGCPLESRHLRRLLGNVEARLDETALAYLLAEDLAAAEQTERRQTGEFDAAWGPYFTLKAEALLDRDEIDAARRSLAMVRDAWHRHPTYLAVRRRLGEREGDDAAIAAVEAVLQRLEATRWSGAGMVWQGDVVRSEILPARPSAGLEAQIVETRPDGQPIELWWNGRLVDRFVVRSGQSLVARFRVDPEPSLLELRSLDWRPVALGPIALLDPSP